MQSLMLQEKNLDLIFKKSLYIAGHSLGEYSALCCFGAITFEDTLKILKRRGKFMQDAVPANDGCMLAVLSNFKAIEEIIKKNNHECYVANDNSPQQVVISGLRKNINLLSEDLNKLKNKNIKLKVKRSFSL